MRFPVLLSPVQPCPTRTKHAASYIPSRAGEEGGKTEEVRRDGGKREEAGVYLATEKESKRFSCF